MTFLCLSVGHEEFKADLFRGPGLSVWVLAEVYGVEMGVPSNRHCADFLVPFGEVLHSWLLVGSSLF